MQNVPTRTISSPGGNPVLQSMLPGRASPASLAAVTAPSGIFDVVTAPSAMLSTGKCCSTSLASFFFEIFLAVPLHKLLGRRFRFNDRESGRKVKTNCENHNRQQHSEVAGLGVLLVRRGEELS